MLKRPSGTKKKWKRFRDHLVHAVLFLAAASSVLVTGLIIYLLVSESLPFFQHVSFKDFLTDPQWTPLFDKAHFGIRPLLAGTLLTTLVALVVAIPVGTTIAIYISNYLSPRLRELVKPLLELLAAVPSVIYGYFALMVVTPLLQKFMPRLDGFNVLSAGFVMGIMIIPFVSSLAEDAFRAVPQHLKEAAIGLGASRLRCALTVEVPAALSGLTSAYVLAIARAVGETMIVAIAAGMQPNLSMNPLEGAATITAFIVQVSLGDLPQDSIGYQSIYVAGLSLMVLTLSFNIIGLLVRRRYQEKE